MTSVVCPYCFDRSPAAKLPYRCQMSPTGVRGGKPCTAEEEMRSLLDGWDSGALLRQLERDFAQLSLFGLSALGSPPPAHAPADAPKSGPQPLRVEDPLLWLLGLGGLLPQASGAARAGGRGSVEGEA
ncbi:hypothetical protein [Streptomyces sp. NPDC096339]|uniref:hypothetical protein n=1 Tax=Streptomyces sp. NPDC096339 TaxID=3366086 RepID=UPI0038295453